MLAIPISVIPPGPFDITCKDIVSVEGRHGDAKFRQFVIPADRYPDFKKGEEERGDTEFDVTRTSKPRRQDVGWPMVWV